MKTFAAIIVALSLFSAAAANAMTDTGVATNEAEAAAVASTAFMDSAEFSDAWLLPGAADQVREPERTAFFFWLILIFCWDGPDTC